MTILGYEIYGGDNESYMYPKGYPDRCKACGAKLSHAYNLGMKIKRTGLDIFSTYDHYTIISRKLMEYLLSKKIPFKYYNLNNYPDYFLIDRFNLPQIEIDDYVGLQFVGQCKICGHSPTYGSFSLDKPILEGLYRTDLLFSDPGKESPVLIVGIETYKELKLQRFKGMTFTPIKAPSSKDLSSEASSLIAEKTHLKKNKKVRKTKTEHVQYGDPRPLDDVYLEDLLAYPIWTWALDQESEYGMDETWVYPITNTKNVTDDMIDVFILLKDDNGKNYMASYFTDEECIDTVYRYDEFDFIELRHLEDIKYPFKLFAVPEINNLTNVEFEVTDAINKFYCKK